MKGLSVCWIAVVISAPVFSATGSESQLMAAAEKDDRTALRKLLAQHVSANAKQSDGATALAWAAHWDDLEVADLLIRAGANVNTANDLGVTPLSLACTNGSAPMVERL